MRLSARALNRTLLRRQHLLERTDAARPRPGRAPRRAAGPGAAAAVPLARRASRPLRPARRDPWARGPLAGAAPVDAQHRAPAHGRRRAGDAVVHRARCTRASARSARTPPRPRHLDPAEVERAVREVLDGGSLPLARLGERLAERWPDIPANALNAVARLDAPVVQVPPRGAWKQSGGVAYAHLEDWMGHVSSRWTSRPWSGATCSPTGPPPPPTSPPGAASPAWPPWSRAWPTSRSTRTSTASGSSTSREPPLAEADEPAPVRLLGLYDNVWLSHAGRDRVTAPEQAQALDGRQRRHGQHRSSSTG